MILLVFNPLIIVRRANPVIIGFFFSCLPLTDVITWIGQMLVNLFLQTVYLEKEISLYWVLVFLLACLSVKWKS